MTDFSEQSPDSHPDRNRHQRRLIRDLDALRAHPSLGSLAGKGALLDRLPTGSTAFAFAGTLAVSMIAFGTLSAVLVVLLLMLSIGLVASALLRRDVRAARSVLKLTRVCLLTWILAGATMQWLTPSTPTTLADAASARSVGTQVHSPTVGGYSAASVQSVSSVTSARTG